ncbi:hypothetical protein BJV82DRAFT_372237 [Fennellomyces sp. T-0311]|nr:hypothetical protein BJV82DRAFT_372237 [Fennellomyces sp. T-0311]
MDVVNSSQKEGTAMMNGSMKRGQTIADLEIEKTSLLAVNTTLEATLRRQAERIVELEKRLEINDHSPLTPVSDKPLELGDDNEALTDKLSDQDVENDQVFQRLRAMLQSLIDDAEAALLQQKASGGRVLHDYEPTISAEPPRLDTKDEMTIRKLAARRSWSPPTHGNTAIMNRQNQRPPRRVSDGQDRGRPLSFHSRPKSPSKHTINHTKTSMARTLSRSSSPAVLVSSPSPPASPVRANSPRPFSPPPPPTTTTNTRQRPPSRASSLRREQQAPRWQY